MTDYSKEPLGAAVMRERAAATCLMVDQTQGEPETQFDKGYDQACVENAEIILKLPLPTHAELLAHALTLPEIKAMVENMEWAQPILHRKLIHMNDQSDLSDFDATLAALEPK
jgi:hypothetical protein